MYDEVKYAQQPVTEGSLFPGELSGETKQNSLNMINQIRFIAGLPEVSLAEGQADQQQALALLADKDSSHSLKKPVGMSDELYALANGAVRSSNLGKGYLSLNDALVHGFMADNDPANLNNLGHRRWMLNPKLGKTAFGAVGSAYTMSVSDKSVSYAPNGVIWPARQMPVEFFDSSYPWSFSQNSAFRSEVTVKVIRISDGREWNFSSESSDGYFNVNNVGYGQSGCVIFLPDGITCGTGEVYEVQIMGASEPVDYTVEFFSLNEDGSYTVNYDGCNSPAEFPVCHIEVGSEMQISAREPYMFPKNFLGWARVPGAVEAEFYPGETFIPDRNTTLYPVWKEADLLTGEFPMSVSSDLRGVSYVVYAFKPEMTGVYAFEGTGNVDLSIYVNEENGMVLIEEGADKFVSCEVECTAGRTYYIELFNRSLDAGSCTLNVSLPSCMVTLINNDGTDYSEVFEITQGTALGTLPSPVRTGYTFKGWYTEAIGGTKVTSETVFSNSVILYAQWEKKNYPEVTAKLATNAVTVNWEPLEGTEKYRVYYKLSGGSWTKYKDVTGTSCDVTGLTTNTKYYFTVRGISADGKSYTSSYDSKGKSVTYKATPVIKSLTVVGNAVNVKWNSINGADIYRVYYKTGSGSWKKFADVSDTSCDVTGLSTGVNYSFTIRGIASDGVTYTTNYDTTGKSITYKATPVLKSVSLGTNEVNVSWEAVKGAELYRVFTKTEGGSWKTYTDVTETNCKVTGLSTNTKYYFTVRAVTADGKTYTSNYDTAGKGIVYKAIPVISGITREGVDVKVSFDAVNGADAYRVYYKKSGNGNWTKAGDTDATEYTISGLTEGVTYMFTVRCITADGKGYTSDYDKVGTGYTLEPAPAENETEEPVTEAPVEEEPVTEAPAEEEPVLADDGTTVPEEDTIVIE